MGVSGEPLSTWDFAADDKVQKAVARVMLRMVDEMNTDYLGNLPGRGEPSTVTCRTCHAARPRPIPLKELLLEVVRADGVGAAVERYRSLRERYYAADAYDFNEYVLRRVANGIDATDPGSRLAIPRLNLEFYPDSWHTFLALGDAYLLLAEPEVAEVFFERSLLIQPSAAGLDGLGRARASRDRP